MPWGLGLFGGLFAGLRAPEKLIPGRAHLQCFGGKRGETEACQLPSMEASLLFSWVVGVMALSTATDELGARNYAMFNRHAFGTLHVALRTQGIDLSNPHHNPVRLVRLVTSPFYT